MKKIVLILATVALMVTAGCSKRATVAMSYNYKPEIMNTELDGSVTMRVWAEGRNRPDAIQQAHKEALNLVLFKGYTVEGQRAANTRALILEPNAQTKYRQFFYQFFADEGPYTKFVSREDTRSGTNERIRSKTEIRYGVVVRVLRDELERYLIDEGILIP